MLFHLQAVSTNTLHECGTRHGCSMAVLWLWVSYGMTCMKCARFLKDAKTSTSARGLAMHSVGKRKPNEQE